MKAASQPASFEQELARMQKPETEDTRVETIAAATIYLMTHYSRTGCPRLAMCGIGICTSSPMLHCASIAFPMRCCR